MSHTPDGQTGVTRLMPSTRDLLTHTAAYGVFYSLLGLPGVALAILYATRDVIAQWPLWLSTFMVISCAISPFIAWLAISSRRFKLAPNFNHVIFGDLASFGTEIRILNTYIPQIDLLAPDLLNAIQRGATVNILLLNPNCPEVEFRAESLGKEPTYVSNQIKATIEALYKQIHLAAGDAGARLHLHLYESWPPFSYYASDSKAMVGFYLNGLLAVEGPQLILTRDARQFDLFSEQFRRVLEGKHTRRLIPDRDWQKNWICFAKDLRIMTIEKIDAEERDAEDSLTATVTQLRMTTRSVVGFQRILLERRWLSYIFTPIYDLGQDLISEAAVSARPHTTNNS